jgi:hypothetical protein
VQKRAHYADSAEIAERAAEICLDWRSEARGKCDEMGRAYEAWQAEMDGWIDR